MAIDLTFGLTTSLGYIEKLSFHAFMNHDSTNKYAWSNQMGNEVSIYQSVKWCKSTYIFSKGIDNYAVLHFLYMYHHNQIG